ncbi:MAG: tRNA (N(6)-L-threonylcarbamoyladenosine(37)-C(2))-methylthiotransferase MtaB [Oscillospiraceae bacterium]|nr:tRNA (N(6)-L-threonylcarbamoyladenosine(37)-C(2))-methylthiotransferase MtaB [Oscillospiraceae bacterium]
MKVYFETYGCKVNSYETESMTADFRNSGYEICDNPNEADIIIVNSCTVTASGDSKSLYAVRKHRKDNPSAVIVLTGCLPQASPKIADKILQADIVTGTKERSKVRELVEDFITQRERIINIVPYNKCDKFEKLPCGSFENRTRAFIKIQDGCNQFCSYCLIPYARGRCRSKPVEDIKAEVCEIAESGIREIVLVGINLMFYGREFGLRLVDAVETCCEITGVERVRLGSLEPEMISDEDLLRLSKLPQFCPQFHLSLQSGCDKTLKDMNRHYTSDEYYELVQKIRNIFPDCAITTDIMVGFPQETDEDFEISLEFVTKVGFSKIHVFQYSPRKGTAAAERNGQISKEVKHERAERMKALGDELLKNHLQKQVGKVVPVLFERENSPDFHQGHAPDYTLIKIFEKNFKKSLRRSVFCVKIEESDESCCIGKIID